MKMSTGSKLTPEERRDLDKFAKFLALKSAVIIVESRLGAKVYTKCNPASNKDVWFNLAVNDLPEVSTEAKKLMSIHGEITTSRQPLCVEIYLRTADDDVMTLETWCIGVGPAQSDSRMNYSIYGRMGILLKTLVSVTRVTPAYRMSRRQGPDSYTINYKIYMGDPQLHSLGDGYNKVQVGQLSTPIGTVHLSVCYRTDLTIQPQKIGKDHSIMYKSDHFRPDFSPKNSRTPKSDDPLAELSPRVGAFAASTPRSRPPLEPGLIIPDVPFSSLLTPRKVVAQSPPPATPPPSIDLSDERSDPGEPEPCTGTGPVACSYEKEDFIMVDLKTPFTSSMASAGGPGGPGGVSSTSDLSIFYKECQTAPPLLSFKERPVAELTRQLEDYETKLRHCDDIISSLCLGDETDSISIGGASVPSPAPSPPPPSFPCVGSV
uniref:Autophagy-related protein 13 n=1 Tax=Cacopsylla melanoneura TaxID=428564 RepID=A0A8D8YI99_9HEMI